MKRQNIIVVISPNVPKVETFGNFKKMCEIKSFPYHSLKTKDFPFTFGEFEIHRTPFL